MRFFLVLIIILNINYIVKADDIKDFQIEGMSIGDSALDFFTKSELIKEKEYYRRTNSKKFYMTSVNSPKFKKYDNIMFHFKNNDPSFIIHSISAAIWFSDSKLKNLSDCKIMRNKIDNQLTQLFSNLDRDVHDNKTHQGDITGKSSTHSITYWFENNHNAGVACYILSKEFGGTSHLKVMVNSNELIDWINNVVYK
tara:strand:- start:14253 stop:14843 length:591 start_codon:yes stop_codon:yes gene_type:complete